MKTILKWLEQHDFKIRVFTGNFLWVKKIIGKYDVHVTVVKKGKYEVQVLETTDSIARKSECSFLRATEVIAYLDRF